MLAADQKEVRMLQQGPKVHTIFVNCMIIKKLLISLLITTSLVLMSFDNSEGSSWNEENCLFRNPLCFYNTDILDYQQILFKNMQFDKMVPFFYGPLIKTQTTQKIISNFSKAQFGYDLKRVGIKTNTKNSWSIMYQKTIMGTKSDFLINCALINDTCRIWLDQETYNSIFTHQL